MIKHFIQKNIWLLGLILISIISHIYIFFDWNILSWGDWPNYFNSQATTVSNFSLYLSSFNLGSVMPWPAHWVFYQIFNFFTFFNISWDIFTRFFFTIPVIILTPIFSFFLFKKITKNEFIAFSSAALFCFNTFFLRLQLDFLTYASLWWVLPALILSSMNYLEQKKDRYLIVNIFLVAFGIVYEARIMVLVLFTVVTFLIIVLFLDKNLFKEKINKFLFLSGSYTLGVMMHLFWIIPLLFTEYGGLVFKEASPTPFVTFYNMLDALTLHAYTWSHNLNFESFIRQEVEWRFLLVPIITFIGFSTFKKYFIIKWRNTIIFFATMLAVALFLGKQGSNPFPSIYDWFFNNIPLFNLYRESGKFYLFIAIPMSLFFGIGIFYIYDLLKKRSKIVSVVLVTVLLFICTFFNTQHFIDQKIGGMVKGRVIPGDYQILEKYLSKDKEYSRVLWFPTKARYSFFSETHPFINSTDLTSFFKDRTEFVLFDGTSSFFSQLTFLFSQPYADFLFDKITVRYIIVPIPENRVKMVAPGKKEIKQEIFESYGNYQDHISFLDSLPYLNKIDIGTKDLLVYENDNVKTHFFTTNEVLTLEKDIPYKEIEVESKNPLEYNFLIRNISEPIYLNFQESYNNEWRLKVGDVNWLKSIFVKRYFVDDQYHYKSDIHLNYFLIDPSVLCANEQCILEDDGSYTISFTLFNKQQAYFYLGLLFSGILLIVTILYFTASFIKKRGTFNKRIDLL